MRYTRFVPLTVAALVAAACSSGSNHAATNSASTTTTGGTASNTTTAASGSTTTSNASSSARTATGGGGAGGTTTTAPGASGTPKPSTAAETGTAPKPAAAGTYQERQSGSFTALGSTKAVPPQGSLVVDPAQSNGTQVWHRNVQQGQPSDDTTLQFTSKGSFLLSTTEPSPQGNVTCTFNPPIPAPAWPPAAGDTFSSTVNCGSFTISIAGRITGQRTDSVAGTSYTTWVVDTTLTFHGQLSGGGTQEDWYSPALRVPLHEYSQLNGKYGPFAFSSNVTSDVTSLP